MPAELATIKDLEEAKSEIMQAIAKLNNALSPEPIKEYLKVSEVLELFDISPNTLTKWRVELGLPSSRIGGQIYYSISDIRRFFDQNKVSTQSFTPDGKIINAQDGKI